MHSLPWIAGFQKLPINQQCMGLLTWINLFIETTISFWSHKEYAYFSTLCFSSNLVHAKKYCLNCSSYDITMIIYQLLLNIFHSCLKKVIPVTCFRSNKFWEKLRSAGSKSRVIRARKWNSSRHWSDLILRIPLLVPLTYFGWSYNLQLSDTTKSKI